MTTLVTGDTGFIGSHMKDFLKNSGIQVIGYSKSNGYDIFNKDQLSKVAKEADTVYHFAAEAKPGESVLKPKETIEENLIGTLNVLEVCRRHDIKLVYPSSCEIYGDSIEPLDEKDELKPSNPYSASKAALDRICFTYYKSYSLDVKIVRLFNPYGPRQQLNKVIPTFYFQAIENKPITVYGDGTDTRDYVYIDDIIQGLWNSENLPKGEAINLATGISTTNLQLAQLIIEETNSDSEIHFKDYPKEFGGIINQVGSNKKAKELMDWYPKIPLKIGVRETIKWLETLGGGP